MYASNYFEEAMLNLMRGQSITAPSNLYVGLFQSNPGDSGTEGTEITYLGYQRQAITFSAPAASGAALSTQNTAVITFPEASTSAGTITYVGVFDQVTGGNMWLYGQLGADSTLNIQPGVSPVFRAGSLKWIWTGNLSTYYKTAIINVLRGTTLSGFTPYIGLCNGDPTGSGNEFSGNNYSRFQVTMTAPTQQTSGACLSQNSSEVISPIASGSWGQLDTVAIYNAQNNGQAYAVIPLGTYYTMTTGYAAGFHAGDLQVNIN